MEKLHFDIIQTSKNTTSSTFKINICFPNSLGWIDNVTLHVENEADYPLRFIKNEDGIAYFETYINLNTKAIYRYFISFKANGNLLYVNNKEEVKDKLEYDEVGKLSVNFDVPQWANGKIMYHIFVDRFNRVSKTPLLEMPRRTIHSSWDEEIVLGASENGIWNADFYGGNLLGIIDKLEYIKSLGVSIIYLSPVVTSQSNHRYDTSDYLNVDPYAGCNEDLKLLCDKAHLLGMKVVLDAVFNHTGNDSIYFNEYNTFNSIGAYQSSESKYSSFYRKVKGNFDYWWGMKNLPVCDGESISWQNYIYGTGGVIDKWFSLGIDGLRLDVADELTDNFIEGIRQAVRRNKSDGFILGEVWKNPMRMNRGYLSSGKGMDSVMNYSLVDALIRYFKYCDVDKIKYTLKDILAEYPTDTINSLMNFTSTHDISRAINIFGSYAFSPNSEWSWNTLSNDLNWLKNFRLSEAEYYQGRDMYMAYVYTLAFLPGILSIFYGDEIGMQGMGNLLNRKPFTWDNIDYDLLNFFKWIGTIRQNEKFLENASLNIYDINQSYLMFERQKDDNSMLVTINRTNSPQRINLPSEYADRSKVYTLKRYENGLLDRYGAVAIKK